MSVVVMPSRIDQELPLKYKAQHVAARVGPHDQPEWYTWNCDRPTWARKNPNYKKCLGVTMYIADFSANPPCCIDLHKGE